MWIFSNLLYKDFDHHTQVNSRSSSCCLPSNFVLFLLQNTSKAEAQVCAEVMEEKREEIEQGSKEAEQPLHQNGEVVDQGGGARRSVLCLSTGAAEVQLADEEQPRSGQMAGSTDNRLLDSEFMEVRQASKPQTTEPSEWDPDSRCESS